MKHPEKLKIIFTRKIKIIVLVSFVSLVALTYTGCSQPFFFGDNQTESAKQRYAANLVGSFFQGLGDGARGPEFPFVLPRRGIVTTDVFGADQILTAARQMDGKIVVAGIASRDIALVRYNPSGSLDQTFGTGGKVITNFFDATNAREQGVGAVVIQPDGKIVVAGMVLMDVIVRADFNKYDIGLARYNTDGSLDPTFGTGGKVITNIAANKADVITSLALQPDGKIVAAGFNGAAVSPQIPSDFVLVRYNSNGSLDATFGAGGIVITDFNNDIDFASSLVIQADGKMVAGGWTYNLNDHSYDFALARYDLSGNLDNSFGSGGKVVIDLSNSVQNDPGGELLTSMVLLPNGKILAAGTGEPNRHTTATDFLIARFNSDGSLDTTFGNGGKVTTDFNGTIDFATSIALQPDGRFVVAGIANGWLQDTLEPALKINSNVSSTHSPTFSDFAVARYNPDGSLDQSFGTGGKGTTDIFGSLDAATKVLIMPNGNILALGYTQTTPYDQGQDQHTDFASVMYMGAVLQRRKLNDFDGDLKAEFAVFRPSNATWYLMNSFSNSSRTVQFGVNTDKPVVGDYDGDGFADIAVYRGGSWNILQSSDGSTRVLSLGQAGDIPVRDDYDGDGKTDIAVWRPSNGTWYWQNSGNSQFGQTQFGQTGDLPVNGDYDGDGRSDISYFHPADGTWHRINSSNGASVTVQFGANGDKPLVGDYDGDGIFDFAVFRPSDQTWNIRKSTDGTTSSTQFGLATDIPIPADYDGDQLTDIAVFRPSDATWQGLKSSGGTFNIQFGATGDIPVPSVDVATSTTAAAVSVSGRVSTPDGRGLRNATVSITDSNGVTRTATTSSFGFYSFDNVASGQQYTIRVSSRLYRFASRTLQVNDTLTNIDFVGLE